MSTYTVALTGGKTETVEAHDVKSDSEWVTFYGGYTTVDWGGIAGRVYGGPQGVVAQFPASRVVSVTREPDPEPDPVYELAKRVEANNHLILAHQRAVEELVREARRRWWRRG